MPKARLVKQLMPPVALTEVVGFAAWWAEVCVRAAGADHWEAGGRWGPRAGDAGAYLEAYRSGDTPAAVADGWQPR